jgi:hypothetical protein
MSRPLIAMVAIAGVAACGGSPSQSSPTTSSSTTSSSERESPAPGDPYTWYPLPSPDLAGAITIDREAGVTSAAEFDGFTSVFFNESLEELGLDAVEEHLMPRIGLDPEDSDDYQLLAFVIRGFHYRFYARENDGLKRDLAIYLYNLDGVRTTEPIEVLDARALEGLAAEEVGAALHEVFDPIRASGEPRALVAFSDTRAGERDLRLIFINAFAEDVVYATEGAATITGASTPSGPLASLDLPARDLMTFDVAFEGVRDGRTWQIQQDFVPLVVSQSHD